MSEKRKTVVTEPVLRFTFPAIPGKQPERTIELWVYDAFQFADIPGISKQMMGGGKTGGLIYITHDCNGVQWNETNVNANAPAEKLWAWIQEWMEKGFRSEGLIRKVVA
jgi:hypothetical protein